MLPLSKPKPIDQSFDFQQELPQWKVSAGSKSLQRQFIFSNFEKAFEFMTLCARFAEEIDHHPDWSNSWNRVSVSLSTHSADGLTELDITMAHAMDQFANSILQSE
ncbi:MAG: 4a-hydroxytetrahydrobiopterin dehydratase [Polynucleobacter sp. 32-46-5]|nr:MAG: 4a-hydroxytetrahydrobiopterin dehydratase [Polynucleobacter sp. 32-46-5]